MGEGGFGKGGFKGGKGKKGKKGDGKKGKKGGEEKWTPHTKLGRLVADGKIGKIEDIYLHGLAIREYQIVDYFFPAGALKDEVMKIHPVQKMTSAGKNIYIIYIYLDVYIIFDILVLPRTGKNCI